MIIEKMPRIRKKYGLKPNYKDLEQIATSNGWNDYAYREMVRKYNEDGLTNYEVGQSTSFGGLFFAGVLAYNFSTFDELYGLDGFCWSCLVPAGIMLAGHFIMIANLKSYLFYKEQKMLKNFSKQQQSEQKQPEIECEK